MRNGVLHRKEPLESAFKVFSADFYSQANYTMHSPEAYLSRGAISNYTSFANNGPHLPHKIQDTGEMAEHKSFYARCRDSLRGFVPNHQLDGGGKMYHPAKVVAERICFYIL